jgi:DNA-binding NtrC family response regulator/pSer/pThr/pTyr-binding forkhead associated (FHA) protein
MPSLSPPVKSGTSALTQNWREYEVMRPKLVATSGPLVGQSFSLPDGQGCVGRAPNNWIAVKSATMSRQHFVVEHKDRAWRLADLDSRNGTFVNEEPVREKWLEHGDRIQAGEAEFLFVLEEDSSVQREALTDSVVTKTVYVHKGESSFLRPWAGAAVAERRLSALLRIGAAVQGAGALRDVQAVLDTQVKDLMPADKVEITTGEGGDSALLAEDTLGGNSMWTIRVPLRIASRSYGALVIRSAQTLTNDHLDLAVAMAALIAGPVDSLWRIEQLERDLRRSRAEGGQEMEFVGDSVAMDRVHELIRKAAPTQATILLTGENGTGKELAARAIHRTSPRVSRPFIAVNCAALKDTLMESEMFGHEKGAFTGAVLQRKGRVEMAEGGTLFLDEVGELEAPIQAKLLRLLQEREYERVGGSRTLKADVRFIAATNRDLKEEIKTGRFREDLFYRLNVVSIVMPPLRERREDIPVLVTHFLQRAAVLCKRRVVGVSPAAREVLMQHDWPGNVRELHNAIERAVVLGSSEWIEVEDLPEDLLESDSGSHLPVFHEAVRDSKKRQIREAIQKANGNISEAARALALHPNYLHRLVTRMGLRDSIRTDRASVQKG